MTARLPWIEKYRPKNFNGMVGHEEKIVTLRNLINRNELPHLLFYGPPGTGKTSLILATAKEMYGPDYKMYILELNASDDRGINVVRDKIPNFVKTKSDKLRLVILDEADAMTQEAQGALRRVMEQYIKTSRFCLICNNFNKIIDGVKSRCSIMRFGSLDQTEVYTKIRTIADNEEVYIEDGAIHTLIDIEKDLRQTLNTLQGIHNKHLGSSEDGKTYKVITSADIYDDLGKPPPEECKKIVDEMFNGNFQEIYDKLLNIFKDNRWNSLDLIVHLGKEVISRDLRKEEKFYLLQKLSKIEYRIVAGRDSEIQLAALVAAFQNAKNK